MTPADSPPTPAPTVYVSRAAREYLRLLWDGLSYEAARERAGITERQARRYREDAVKQATAARGNETWLMGALRMLFDP